MQSYANSHNSMDAVSATPSEAPPMETSPSPPCHRMRSDEVTGVPSHFPVIVKEEEKPVKINNNDDNNNTDSTVSPESRFRSVPPHVTSTPSCPAQGRFTVTYTEDTLKPTGSDLKIETPCSWRSSAGVRILVCE